MKILWSWLTDYLEGCTRSAEEVARLLTLSGTETIVTPAYEWAKPFRVVLVESVERHPQAEALSICQVKDGKGQVRTIVCGASNVRAGMKSILAIPGHPLPGEKSPLQPAVLRGVRSEGMLCSAEELGLEDLEIPDLGSINEGIFDIPMHVPLGTSLQDMLNKDALLHLEITPNRGDLLSHLGVARELAALGVGTLIKPPLPAQESWLNHASPINVQTQACWQVYLCELDGLRQEKTPPVMRRRLAALGVKLHFPCVDMTNYSCHDVGRPLHVFDADDLEGSLVIRLSQAQEKFQGLDGSDYSLPEGLVVIADHRGIVSLAGVMGGRRGSCKPSSTHVLLESAQFDPRLIARAGQLTQISSDARYRFERGVDSAWVKPGVIQAVTWIQKHCQGRPLQSMAYGTEVSRTSIPFDFSSVQRLGGAKISDEDIQKRLEALGAQVGYGQVIPPSWRPDWTLPQDCVEEVLRLNGYAEVPPCPLPGQAIRLKDQHFSGTSLPSMDYTLGWKARRFFVSQGLFEVVTWSFVSPAQAQIFSGETPPLTLDNPISQDLSVLRTSLLPHLINLYEYHKNHHLNFAPVFEIGPRFDTVQEEGLTALFPMVQEQPWPYGRQEISFYKVKSLVEGLFHAVGAAPWQCHTGGHSWYHPGRCAQFWQGDLLVGTVGQLHPRLKVPAWGIEIDLSRLSLEDKRLDYIIPSLQPVSKDLSFFMPETLQVGPFIETLRAKGQPELIDLQIIDLFHEERQPCSITLRGIFQPQEHSFSHEQLHDLMDRLIKCAQNQGASLRGQWEE